MNKEQLVNHVKNATKQGFISKFERETRCSLNEYGEVIGYRLFLRGFTMYEIKEYLIG
jgi:hypothetical protein